MPVRYPCGICKKPVAVTHNAINCDLCLEWVHAKCNYIYKTSYNNLKICDEPWYCKKCIQNNTPFSNLSDEMLKLVMQGKNVNPMSHAFDIENETNKQLFKSLDTLYFEGDTNNNNKCSYYSPSEVNNLKIKKNAISLLHLNISSLNYHYDDFETLLSTINLKPSLIGITETRHKKGNQPLHNTPTNYSMEECQTESNKGNQPLHNTPTNYSMEECQTESNKGNQPLHNTPTNYSMEECQTESNKGNQPLHNTPTNYSMEECQTESNKGGALLYISNKFNYKIRKDLTMYKKKELESVFVEIINKKGKNSIIGCIYRHPSMHVSDFIDNYTNNLFEKLSYENKDIILMGNFNINLLNIDSDKDSEEFLEQITTNYLIPLILKPTRITPS